MGQRIIQKIPSLFALLLLLSGCPIPSGNPTGGGVSTEIVDSTTGTGPAATGEEESVGETGDGEGDLSGEGGPSAGASGTTEATPSWTAPTAGAPTCMEVVIYARVSLEDHSPLCRDDLTLTLRIINQETGRAGPPLLATQTFIDPLPNCRRVDSGRHEVNDRVEIPEGGPWLAPKKRNRTYSRSETRVISGILLEGPTSALVRIAPVTLAQVCGEERELLLGRNFILEGRFVRSGTVSVLYEGRREFTLSSLEETGRVDLILGVPRLGAATE